MINVDTLQRLYEELAERSARQQEARQRDIFLGLAADAAIAAGRREEAERLRQKLLQLNPHSLLRPYASFDEALQSSDIQDYVADLRRLYPPTQAEKLLHGANGKNDEALPIYRFQDPEPQRVAAAPVRSAVATPKRATTESPYARFDVLSPPGKGLEAGGGWVAMLLYFFVFAAALGLAAYVIVRPFLL